MLKLCHSLITAWRSAVTCAAEAVCRPCPCSVGVSVPRVTAHPLLTQWPEVSHGGRLHATPAGKPPRRGPRHPHPQFFGELVVEHGSAQH